ncbi:hypothetical protein JHK82_012045 [Glycine max]|nr:hypothetical protein JHK85_012366 [Glycine max]KAG5057041.1 hypothetical protein JHK86_012037 [Glycine max]KAG5154076.1 hypothetical protein JHK82_012045 [Glycine max]
MQLRFQLQGRSSVMKGKQGRVKETEGVLNGAVYSHCHGFFSVQKILRRELGMEIIEEHTVMEYSKSTRNVKNVAMWKLPIILDRFEFDWAIQHLELAAAPGTDFWV